MELVQNKLFEGLFDGPADSQDSDRVGWPSFLNARQIASLEAAGYTPEVLGQATPEDLLAVDHIGPKTVQRITGADLTGGRPEEIEWLVEIIRRSPPRVLYERIAEVIRARRDEDLLRACYQEWMARGYNPVNYSGWLLGWYASGRIPRRGSPPPHRVSPYLNGGYKPNGYSTPDGLEAAIARLMQQGQTYEQALSQVLTQ